MSQSRELIRIGTRGSQLALWQAHYVKDRLEAALCEPVEVVPITTRGDKAQGQALSTLGGKGAFVKEIEDALLVGEVDLAVHSLKDVPVTLPEGLEIAAVCERGDPRDAFLSPAYRHPQEMPRGARIGTSSLRRRCQLQARFPCLEVVDIRGNVDTRLRKLDDGKYEAVALAAAGLRRLGWEKRITALLDPRDSLPAMGQGTIALECREDDGAIRSRLRRIEDPETAVRTRAEWAFNRRLQGGCEVPMAGFAELVKNRLRMRGLVGEADGSQLFEDEISGDPEEAEALGAKLGERLLAAGANVVLERYAGGG